MRMLQSSVILILALGQAQVFAQDTSPQVQQELEQVKEAMRQAGIDPEQMQQLEAIMGQIGQQETARREARGDGVNAEYEELHEGFGVAVVSIGEDRLELDLIQCSTRDLGDGLFAIEALHGPNRNAAQLIINGAGRYAPSTLVFSDAGRRFKASNASFDFDGQRLAWAGSVDGPDGPAKLDVTLTCRAEDVAAQIADDRPGDRVVNSGGSAMPSPFMPPSVGNATIRVIGMPQSGQGAANFTGDCDGASPDDDLEVMSFTAPWNMVGASGGGMLIGSHMLDFEKSKELPRKRLTLRFQPELRQPDLEALIDRYGVVAEIPFAGSTVKLVFANETRDFKFGYNALYPIAVLENMAYDPRHTGRYLAHVHFGPIGPLDFDGWSEAEIVDVFKSLRTAPCTVDTLKRDFAPFNPRVIYE